MDAVSRQDPRAWEAAFDRPPEYEQRGVVIPDAEDRAITLPQLLNLECFMRDVLVASIVLESLEGEQTCGRRISWGKEPGAARLNMYHINTHFVMPLTAPFQCSFVELVAETPQIPQWFVSHFWGAPFQETVRMLSYHGLEHELESGRYWIW